MKKILLILTFLIINTFAFTPDDKYKIFKAPMYSIIYTDEYKKEAAFIKENLDDFLKVNDKLFSFSLDEPLKLILVSSKNEIANAFSTQVPFNMTAFYNGGAHKLDYFNTKSWVITLMTHELIHNYQMNAKKSEISKVLHKYLGNNAMPLFAGVPFFTYPNFLLPTFIVEGNAVLNEGVYNNGGRLLSGRLNALKNLLVLDGKIDSTSLINNHQNFPYLEEKYIVGGFYMQYLAKKFGLKKVNSFFWENSIYSINPLRLRNSFYKHFKVDIKKTIRGFVNKTIREAGNFKRAQGELLASSQREIYLNKQDDEVYFISHDLKTRPVLHVHKIKAGYTDSFSSSWSNGKVFKVDGKYYTDSSGIVNTDEYRIGLFDDNRIIKEDTISKFVQDINGKDILYINMKNSFSKNRLYLNEYFYDEVNSSALFDENKNIYYFKQNDIKRELYKNKKKILEFNSFYSKIVDIKDEKIYFIASSRHGSSLFMFDGSNVKQVHEADNIVDAKVLDNDELIISVITSSSYKVLKSKISLKEKGKIFEYTKPLRGNVDFTFKDSKSDLEANEKYSEFKELEYSNTQLGLGQYFFWQSNFVDPALYNQVSLGAYKNEDLVSGFVTYINQRHFLPISMTAYMTDRDDRNSFDRGYGLVLKTKKDLYKDGLNDINTDFTYYLDDEFKEKSPSILSLNYNYDEYYPLGYTSYKAFDLELTGKKDRGELYAQAKASYTHYLFKDTYIKLNALGAKSNVASLNEGRGIKLSDEYEFGKDKTTLYIEGLDDSLFVNDINNYGIAFSKTFHFSKYFFSSPFSFINQTVFYKYNHYDVFTTKDFDFDVHVAGVQANMLFLNTMVLPITLKVIKNDYSKDEYQAAFEIGVNF